MPKDVLGGGFGVFFMSWCFYSLQPNIRALAQAALPELS